MPILQFHLSHQQFVRFGWKGRTYQFFCLAFGLSPAPRNFTKILKAVMAFVRKQGVRLIIYLDDILIIKESREGLSADLEMVRQILQDFGFIINKEKSILDPTKKIEFLGILISSNWLSFALPPAKLNLLLPCVRRSWSRKSVH
jgi:hypothetical protein